MSGKPRRNPPPPAVAAARARQAILTRHRGPDHPDTLAAARDARAEQLAAHVAREVEKSPPLTPEQLARVASYLLPGADARTRPA